jgi:carnosine N-methyltransferase
MNTYSTGRNRSDRNQLKVLVPGAGLGRLGHEIDQLGGFEVTLNEWSMYMNLAYRFIESLAPSEHHSFHPFVDSWSHHATTKDMQRAVSFPDISTDQLSVVMVEGDFSTAFASRQSHYDFVVTHFFIDTARNLMNYFETIHNVLKSSGYWINAGPLLYGTSPWAQLSLDEIIAVTKDMGFEFKEMADVCGEYTFPNERVRWMSGIYGSNERALNMNGYRVQNWIARKL